MPSQAILKIHASPLANIPGNAYWLTDAETLTLTELKSAVEESSKEIEALFSDPYSDIKDIENHVKHLGYTVSSYIDASIDNLDARKAEISELCDRLSASNDDDANMAKSIGNKSLSLGYDLQMSTQLLMRELEITGEPIDVNRLHGHKGLKDLFVKHSLLFPSTWNEYSSYKHKKIAFLKKESLKFNMKKFRLDKLSHTSSFLGNDDGNNIPEKFEIIYGTDGQFSYPSIEDAERASVDSPLSFYTKHELVHEMTHMYEKDFRLGILTESFLDGRILINPKTGKRSYDNYWSNGSIVYDDHFSNRMCGSVKHNYSNHLNLQDNEIMARGTESVLCGANGSFIGLPEYSQKEKDITRIAPDIDYRNFMLGILFGYRK